MSRVLLIGGCGYIGNVVSMHLLNSGYRVRGFDNFIYDHGNSVIPIMCYTNYEQYFGDILNISDIEKALNNVDAVVLLAGLVGDPIANKYKTLANKINIIGLKNCINSISETKIKKIIFVSTCSNYGFISENIKATESQKLMPLSLYAKAKVEIENFLFNTKLKKNVSPTILRFATAFGLSPRMRFDLTLNEFTYDVAVHKKLEVYDAKTWRPYCHVKDFALMIEKVLKSSEDKVKYEIFNVGSDKNNFTKQQIVDKLINIFPETKVTYRDTNADPRNDKVDFSKVKKN